MQNIVKNNGFYLKLIVFRILLTLNMNKIIYLKAIFCSTLSFILTKGSRAGKQGLAAGHFRQGVKWYCKIL